MTKPYKGLVGADGRVFWGITNHHTGGNEYWVPFEDFASKYFRYACYAAKHRAERDSVPFALTPEFIESIFPADGLCPVFGVPMPIVNESRKHLKPSLDKHIPELGYVPGNVSWMSLEANRLKNNATLKQLESLVSHLKTLNDHQA